MNDDEKERVQANVARTLDDFVKSPDKSPRLAEAMALVTQRQESKQLSAKVDNTSSQLQQARASYEATEDMLNAKPNAKPQARAEQTTDPADESRKVLAELRQGVRWFAGQYTDTWICTAYESGKTCNTTNASIRSSCKSCKQAPPSCNAGKCKRPSTRSDAFCSNRCRMDCLAETAERTIRALSKLDTPSQARDVKDLIKECRVELERVLADNRARYAS